MTEAVGRTPEGASGPAETPPSLDEAIDLLTLGAGRLELPVANDEPTPRFAFKRILAALDDSEASHHALAWTKEMASLFQSRVWVITVVGPEDGVESFSRRSIAAADPKAARRQEELDRRNLVERALATLTLASIPAEARVTRGSPAREIVRFARDHQADLVVMGSHGRGRLGRLVLGSVCDAVKNRVAASILVAKGAPRPSRLLIATDGSQASKRAAGIGERLARHGVCSGILFHVVPSPRADAGGEGLGPVSRPPPLRPYPLPPHLSLAVDTGKPAEGIVRTARERSCNLIVMGSRGLSGWKTLVAGSVSNRVVHEAQASVLLVKDVLRPFAPKGRAGADTLPSPGGQRP